MNDSENSNHNRDQALSESSNVRLNINRRSLNVYEQYLKKKTQELADENNSEPRLDLDIGLANKKKNLRQNLTNEPLVVSHDTAIIKEKVILKANTPIEEKIDPNNTRLFFGEKVEEIKIRPTEKSAAISKLLIVFAVFCSLLLVSVVIVMSNATNSLVALNERLSTVNNQVSDVSNRISVIGTQNSMASARAIADERAANAANAASLTAVRNSLDSIAMNTEQVKAQPTSTRVRSMQIGDTSGNSEDSGMSAQTASGISYEDFTEESRVTLYRESRE